MARDHTTVRVSIGEETLKAMVYRQALRAIAKNPWSEDGEFARRVLAHFGDEGTELLPREGA